MKILLLSNVFPPGFIGGYELGAFDVASGLSRSGHDVTVLTSNYFQDYAQTISEFNVRRHLVCTAFIHYAADHRRNHLDGPFYNFHNIRVLGSTLREIQPDLVMTFNLAGLGATAVLQYLVGLKIPTVAYVMDNFFAGFDAHSQAAETYTSIVGGLELTNATVVVAMSRVVAKEVEDTILAELPSVEYIPGWIDLTEVAHSSELNPREGRTRFVYYSGIVPEKGIDLVLHAARALREEGHEDFTVDVIGGGNVASLLQAIDRLNLKGIVSYRGVVAKRDALRTLSGYDALLFPTWSREPFGFVAVEAAAAGCVPIITGGIGASEWLVDGRDCLLIERTVRSLRSKMLDVVQMSEVELLDLRTSAMQSARASFGFDRWLSQIEQLCLRLISTSLPIASWEETRRGEGALLVLTTLWRESLDAPGRLFGVLDAYRRSGGLGAVRWLENVVLPRGSKRRARAKGLFWKLR